MTTARDMIALALRLQDDFPKHYPLFATRTFTWGGDTFRNHNTLLFNYPGPRRHEDGLHRASGFNLVASDAARQASTSWPPTSAAATGALRNAAVRTHSRPRCSRRATGEDAPAGTADARRRRERPTSRAVPAPRPATRKTAGAEVEVLRVRPVPATARSASAEGGRRAGRRVGRRPGRCVPHADRRLQDPGGGGAAAGLGAAARWVPARPSAPGSPPR